MIAIPAVDLRDGACVQLVGGSYDAERVRLDDPIEVARDWLRMGFTRLHVVDLDAALRRGSNAPLIRDLLADCAADVQVGGGVRDEDRIETLLEDGATRVVVGTRALEEPAWLEEMAREFPGRIVVAADVKERFVVTRGWETTLPTRIERVVETLSELPLAAIMVTAVHREGLMGGADQALMEDVVESAGPVPVYASGGIASIADLDDLAELGVAAAILGMALYTGTLDARVVAELFGGAPGDVVEIVL